jgi:predicted secreted protein
MFSLGKTLIHNITSSYIMKALFTFSLSLCLLLLSANTMMAQNREAAVAIPSEQVEGNEIQSLISKMATAYNLNANQQNNVRRVAVALGQQVAEGNISQNQFQADFKHKMRKMLSAAQYSQFENNADMNQAINAIYVSRKRR